MRVKQQNVLNQWDAGFVAELREILEGINSFDSKDEAIQHLKDWVPGLVLKYQGMQRVPDDIALRLDLGVAGDPSKRDQVLFTIRGGETLPDIPILLKRNSP